MSVTKPALPEGVRKAWEQLHTANRAAHARGAAAGAEATNPYPVGSDERYWWREGHFQRPFAPLTTEAILARIAHDHVSHQVRRRVG